MVFISSEVRNTGADATVVQDRLDVGKNRKSMKNNPFGFDVHLVSEGMAHSIIRSAAHIARYLELERSDVVAVFFGEQIVSWALMSVANSQKDWYVRSFHISAWFSAPSCSSSS